MFYRMCYLWGSCPFNVTLVSPLRLGSGSSPSQCHVHTVGRFPNAYPEGPHAPRSQETPGPCGPLSSSETPAQPSSASFSKCAFQVSKFLIIPTSPHTWPHGEWLLPTGATSVTPSSAGFAFSVTKLTAQFLVHNFYTTFSVQVTDAVSFSWPVPDWYAPQ